MTIAHARPWTRLAAGAIPLLLAAAAAGAEVKPAAAPPKPLLKDFMGINGHFHFKPELYRQVCRLARNYHSLNWEIHRLGDPVKPPMCVNQVDWKANVYGPWKAAGFENDLCVMLNGFGPELPDYQQQWAANAQWAFDYGKAIATCFGPSGAEKLVTSFEIGNEPGTAFDADTYRDLFKQMAGGIRAGDPKATILTATGRATDKDGYSIDLRKHFADPDILPLYDVINVHTYASIPRKDNSECPWTRGYPESPDVEYLQGVDETLAWRDQHAPGKRLWVTEFGYDACTPEAMGRRQDWFLKLDWQGVPDLQQAQYLIRSFCLFAERDVDRAYIYFFDDDDSPSVHGCAGLTRGFVPKPSFWAVKQLYATLGDYRFRRVVKKEANNLYVYEFVGGEDQNLVAWIAWSPTGMRTDQKAAFTPREAEVTLDQLPAQPEQVLAMATADAEAPKAAWKAAGPKAITLTIGESPTYILMRTGPPPAPKATPPAKTDKPAAGEGKR